MLIRLEKFQYINSRTNQPEACWLGFRHNSSRKPVCSSPHNAVSLVNNNAPQSFLKSFEHELISVKHVKLIQLKINQFSIFRLSEKSHWVLRKQENGVDVSFSQLTCLIFHERNQWCYYKCKFRLRPVTFRRNWIHVVLCQGNRSLNQLFPLSL